MPVAARAATPPRSRCSAQLAAATPTRARRHAARARSRADRAVCRSELARLARRPPCRARSIATICRRTLAERWLTSDGRELVEITPAEDVSDNAAARRFITAVHGVVPNATGLARRVSGSVGDRRRRVRARAPVRVRHGLADHLARAAATARTRCSCSRRSRSRRSLTAALTVVVGMPFNYANIIALPLLVGIGVDNGIHVVHRMRTDDADAPVRHEHDARRARERAHDGRELRQPRVLRARRHREHGRAARARSRREHGRDADRVAGVARVREPCGAERRHERAAL